MIRRAWVLILLAGVPHPAAAATITEVHYVMGTYLRVTADAADATTARAAMGRCFTLVRRLEERFSRFDPKSELSQLNAAPDTSEGNSVGPEMAALLRRALQLEQATGGAFNVAVGAVTQLWRTTAEWPDAAELNAVRATAAPGAFRFAGDRLVHRRGAVLDVDGIAKGWAVDHCVAELRRAGVRRAFINFGESSLYALGAPPNARAWRVMVRGLEAQQALGTVRLRDAAVSVSGVFGHERRIGATRVGHIVDPRTAQPLMTPALAVVVAASATDAEAWSKAVLIRNGAGEVPVAAATLASGMIDGALLVRHDGVQRLGRIGFTAFRTPRRIPAAAEPLR